MDAELKRCACGVRIIGDPLLRPRIPQPLLGGSILALACALVSLLALWNKPFVILGALATIVGWRAAQAARRDPLIHGGRRTASAGAVLGAIVVVGISAWVIAGIPRALRNREEARAAATRAQLYELAGALQQYKARYGAYPLQLSDLSRVSEPVDDNSHDSWEQRISYTGYTGELASAGPPAAFNTDYELRSPGPDGVLNTADDILMRDGIVLDPSSEKDTLTIEPMETKPAPLKERGPRKRADAGLRSAIPVALC